MDSIFQCPHSTSIPDMASSRTVSAMGLTHTMLSYILPLLRQSVSLAEKIMLMGVLTSTLSLTLDENEDSDDMYSRMWDSSIQTLHHLEELLVLRTTMRSKMGMSLEVDSSDLTPEIAAEEEMARLSLRWQRLSESTTNRRFGMLAENWLQAYSYGVIRPLSHMQSADSLRSFNNTAIHANWCSSMREYLNWLRGEKTTLETLKSEEGT
jgi:hypothetical protein